MHTRAERMKAFRARMHAANAPLCASPLACRVAPE